MRTKIGGKHTTVLGGKKGLNLLLKIASNPNVKKVVPGRIGAKGGRSGKGVRVKVTAVDERGNVKLILSEGASNQEIYIVTNLSGYEDGLKFADEIKSLIEMYTVRELRTVY